MYPNFEIVDKVKSKSSSVTSWSYTTMAIVYIIECFTRRLHQVIDQTSGVHLGWKQIPLGNWILVDFSFRVYSYKANLISQMNFWSKANGLQKSLNRLKNDVFCVCVIVLSVDWTIVSKILPSCSLAFDWSHRRRRGKLNEGRKKKTSSCKSM